MNATDLIDQFLDAVWVEQGLSENTLSAYRSDLRIFALWLKDKDLLVVTTSDLSQFLASRYKDGIGNRSSARILSSLRRFYGYAIRENSISIKKRNAGITLQPRFNVENVSRVFCQR